MKMARIKSKWKFLVFSYLILINVLTKSLPVKTPLLATTDTVFRSVDLPQIEDLLPDRTSEETSEEVVTEPNDVNQNTTDLIDENVAEHLNKTRNILTRNVRPGQEIRQYAVELTIDGNNFNGRLVVDVVLTLETREDPIVLHIEDLNVRSVMAGVFSEANAIAASFGVDDGILEIEPAIIASSYILIIEYTGPLTNAGVGLYRGVFGDFEYIGMNLYPTNARRVFPCMDEPTEASIISFTFNNVNYNSIIANSMLEENSVNQFRALQGPPHLWTMAAHNFNNINMPTNNVLLLTRPGITGQESIASVAINNFFNNLNEWTNKPYFEIMVNQNPQLNIIAVPDVDTDWHGISSVAIWEPYILMENTCSTKQRYMGLLKIAKSLARQWFGYVVYPENFRFEWVVSGLATYAAFDILKEFIDISINNEADWIDINALFLTEVIQESLLWDSYAGVNVMEPTEDIFDEDMIRDNIRGIHNYKSPAILRMLRIILGESTDFIKLAAQALIAGRSLQTINSLNFIDAIHSNWLQSGNGWIEDLEDFLEPYTQTSGYPLLSVSWTQRGASVSLERFSFAPDGRAVDFEVPLTYSVSNSPNFDDPQVFPSMMLTGAWQVTTFLDEEDYILFNIQGQGYYRVHYDGIMWERILDALEDPSRRNEIHPLNRATLLDDVMVLARGGRVDYETALMVVLTWEHETEYAPWSAFVRNMNFLKKHLVAMVEDDEDLDQDIYLRMVRRTITAFEDVVGFSPDPTLMEPAMVSLTRGLVMDHACKAGYQPCIAAAVDWFYDPNSNEPIVNPNIPYDIRPAVYCTMVREGGDGVINALNNRLEIEPSMYERIVILQSFGCSRDQAFINQILTETILGSSPYSVEEKLKIFQGVAEGSTENAFSALDFLRSRAIEIRNSYGGPKRLEDVVYIMAENVAGFMALDFDQFVFSQLNNLDDSQLVAERAAAYARENLEWENIYMELVYEWIDENDAPTLMVSFILIAASCLVALLNH